MSETTTKLEAAAAPDDDQTVKRGRPGRRTAQNKAEAVLKLLAGRASVDQILGRQGASTGQAACGHGT